jgi:hypothetical protein
MTINENVTEFAGRRVEDFDAQVGLAAPERIAYRLRLDYDAWEGGTRVPDLLRCLLDDERAPALKALVIGAWDFESSNDPAPIVEMLAGAGPRLSALEALFFGDIVMEEQEISWIQQGDLSPLWAALPSLRVLRVRGSQGLAVGAIRHARLEELAFESGGLPRKIVEAVVAAELPNLRHLELWLGEGNYGYESSIDALGPLLRRDRFPHLRYLGLKDCEEQDAVARAIAASPLLERLEVLDLSMGTLGDEGAQALLGAPGLRRLQKLDIHHHYVSPALVSQLQGLVREVDASEAQESDKDGEEQDRYVAVAE